jgi:MFS transporter, PHS family, inorganic phosphate transporter
MGADGGGWLSFACTAFANFTCQYNFQSIAVCLMIMSASVCTDTDDNCRGGQQAAWVSGSSQAIIFIGAVIGQLSMGFLGDYLTRSNALSVTLALAGFGAFLSAVAPAGNPNTIYSVIIFFRFFVGVGLGGIYPLSATKASEDGAALAAKNSVGGAATATAANPVKSAISSASAFFWQIPGSVAPWLLGYIFTYSSLSTGFSWRLVLGLGAVPAFLSICCILIESHYKEVEAAQIAAAHAAGSPGTSSILEGDIFGTPPPSSPHYPTGAATTTATSAVAGRTASTISIAVIVENLRKKDVFWKLMGVGGSWFLYDIVFYGITLLGGHIIEVIVHNDDDVSTQTNIRSVSSKQSLALSLGGISILLVVWLLPRMSMRNLQIAGFLVQGLFMLLLVSLFSYLKQNDPDGLFALYCLTVMSLQFGVPVTTYALPAVLFEKDIRCTFNGMAAAMGKLGAIVGAYTFSYIALESFEAVIALCAVICGAGVWLTYATIDDVNTMPAGREHGNRTRTSTKDEFGVEVRSSEFSVTSTGEIICFSPFTESAKKHGSNFI